MLLQQQQHHHHHCTLINNCNIQMLKMKHQSKSYTHAINAIIEINF